MSRLIDADKLIEEFNPNGEPIDPITVRMRIVQAPTAYDVDKVLKKISERNIEYQEKYREYQKEKCEMSEEIFYQKAKTMAEAYDIVKAGGRDES